MLRKGSATLIGCIFLIPIPAFAQERLESALREAEELYNRAEYGASLSLLDTHSREPASLFLIGRDYYMLADFKKATKYLKKTVIAAPENSEYIDWLGRAYDKRAELSNPLSAAVLEKKAGAAYERAVQLNPKNAGALSDLFNYYLEKPAVLGGGYGKAKSVAEKMPAADSSLALLEQWELAQKRHQVQTAEQTLPKSVALGPKDEGTRTSLQYGAR